MGAIGEPKREIHIPVTEPASPRPSRSHAGTDAEVAPVRRRPSRSAPEPDARWSLPWDVFATPIAARKLARLGIEHGEVVLRPAFYRQLGAAYGAVAHATCPLEDHDAPGAECSCGFYAVADDTPALAPRRRRARAGGARRRAGGPGHRARPRLPGERPGA